MAFKHEYAGPGQAVDDRVANGGAEGRRVHARGLGERLANGLTCGMIEFFGVENVRRLGDRTAERVAVNHYLVDLLILFTIVRRFIALLRQRRWRPRKRQRNEQS